MTFISKTRDQPKSSPASSHNLSKQKASQDELTPERVAHDFIAKLQVELNGTYITTEPNPHIKKEQNPFPDNTEPLLHSTQLKTNHNYTHVSFVVLKLKINVLLITTSYPLTIKLI